MQYTAVRLLSNNQRRYFLLKKPELLDFVFDRPYEDSLNTGGFVSREFFGADLRRSHEKPLAQLIDGPM